MSRATVYPPGPAGHFLLGVLPDLRTRPLEFMDESVKSYGDVFHFQIAGIHAFQLNHPDMIEEVLVARNRSFIKARLLRDTAELFGRGLLVNEGEPWLRQRRLMGPAFHRARINAYGDLMVEYTARMLDRWHDGRTLDVHEEMMHLTLEIVTEALFGAEVSSSEMGDVAWALDIALKRFVDRIGPMRFLSRLPLPQNLRFRKALGRLDAIIYRIIESRRKSGDDRGDLLAMLLEARDEEGGGMTDLQVRDEVITLFLAGHETTAISLSWTWYLLSLNPEADQKLADELSRVLGGRTPTMDDIPQLEYTGWVVRESMRIYPPAWRVGREAIEDCEIGGYVIPTGAQVILSQWTVHRDERWFSDPLEFRPERWRDDLEHRLPRFAYFPFGGGPRRCIGDSFAMMEATLILAVVRQRFALRLVPDHPIAMWPSITLRPRYGLQMTCVGDERTESKEQRAKREEEEVAGSVQRG